MRIQLRQILICAALLLILIWSPFFPSFDNVKANPFRVFLACSGDDVQKSFEDHLYTSLVQQGVSTFREYDGISFCEDSRLAVAREIYTTELGIIIFSDEYPKWKECFDDLEMIMERKELDGYVVGPIFLNVNRSDVREQTGYFGHWFAELEKSLVGKMDKIEKYKKLLERVAGLQGWSLNKGYEAPFIRRIVDDIKDIRNSRVPSAAPNYGLKILLSIMVNTSAVLLIMVLKWSASPENVTGHRLVPREGDHGEVLQEDVNATS